MKNIFNKFIFFKKNNDLSIDKNNINTYLVDELFYIDLPSYIVKKDGIQFYATSLTIDLEFCIYTYGKSMEEIDSYGKNELIEESKILFKRLMLGSDYMPIYNDLEVGENYVYQSFADKDDIQYFFFTFNLKNNQLFRSDFNLKVKKPFNEKFKKDLLMIGKSFRFIN